MKGLAGFAGGSIKLRIQGVFRERFLNLCNARGIELWNVSMRKDALEGWLLRSSFFQLRPIVRKTKVKVVVLKKSGLPFLLPKLRRRSFFVLGALLTIGFWVLSSFFLWEIKVNGNVSVTEDQFFRFLEEQNISLGEPFRRIDLTGLEKEIRRSFPQIIWTSAKQNGTELIIDVKENDLESGPVEGEPQAQNVMPPAGEGEGWNLVSSQDGSIVAMITRSGTPKVKIGDEVKKGQLLVEGCVPVFGEDGTVKGRLFVKADADIMIEHKIVREEDIERYYREDAYTGRKKREYYCRIGEHLLRLRPGRTFLSESVVETSWVPGWCKKLDLPLGFGRLEHSEYLTILKKYTDAEMEEQISEKIMQFLASLEEKGVQIIEKNVKIEDKGNFVHLMEDYVVQEKAHLYERYQDE